jgi:hypothetical protein
MKQLLFGARYKENGKRLPESYKIIFNEFTNTLRIKYFHKVECPKEY